MSIYVSKDNTVVKAYPRYNYLPVLFGYLNNGSEMKKFYDIAEAINYIEFQVSYIFLDKTTANFTNANESTIAGLSGYGSFTLGSNYVQINSYKNSSSIWLLMNAYVHFKSTNSNYMLEVFWSANKRFVDSILTYAISLTGYCQYRTSSSTSSSGYIQNRVFGNIMLGTESCSTTSTVTKTLGNANTWPYEYAFAYIGAGRSSGSQNIISKLTFNSCTINGVSIPIKLTCLVS